MVSCDAGNLGCNGGNLGSAWNFLEDTGIVTESCWPYESGKGVVPSCRDFRACKDGEPIKLYAAQKGSSQKLWRAPLIQSSILSNGPVETGFIVFQDFMSYKSGIYHHVRGRPLGGHAVKIVGWGVEGTTQFWIVANSWSTSWGEDGFFRIKFGSCGIDTQGIAGIPDLSR
eukprot:TRINITY_DN3995_c0_g1_i5.p1 TRINITY_DN3995_c0_g1~~TRINITY_DN3995_c0_g1_i5.p1  ORF type:complete len:171 (-),score=38.84 TRINITY_DN3995_c0_g1_i5:51-563(-)